MSFGGSFAASLDYNDPGLGASDLSGQHGVSAPAPAAASGGFNLGQLGHSLAGFGGSAVHALLEPIFNVAHVAASAPMSAVHNAIGLGKETAALATGNQKAYSNAVKEQQGAYKKDFLEQRYQSPDSVKNLENAGADALTVATAGAGTLEKAGATEAGNIAQKAGQAIVNNAKNLIGAGRTGNIATQAVKGAVTNAALVQPTTQFAGKTAQDLANADFKNSAIDAVLWGIPGAASLAGKGIKAVAGAAGTALFGKAAILNQMFGSDAVKQFVAEGGSSNVLKQIEQFTLNQKAVGGDVEKAAPWLKNYIENKVPGIGQGAEGLHALVQNFQPYANELTKLQKMQDAGKTILTASGKELSAKALTVSHNFVDNVPAVKEAMNAIINDPQWNDMQFRTQAVKGVMAKLGIADDTLNRQISDNLLNSNTVADANGALDNLVHDSQKYIVKDLGNGFVYTSAPKGAARMPTVAEVKGNDLVTGKAATGVGKTVGNRITKAGLSPRATEPGAFHASVRDNLEQRFSDAHIHADAGQTLRALNDAVARTPGASDVRMLTNKQIRAAVSGDNALRDVSPRIIAKAVRGAYRDVPASVAGAGGKFTNALMSKPLAQYLRVQGLVKFELNPFFRGIKVPIKGAIVAGAHGANVEDIAKAFVGASKETESALRNDSNSWFSGSKSGGSGNVSDELGRSESMGEHVGHAVQSQIVGMVDSVAKAHGTTPKAIIDERGALYNELMKGADLIKGYGKGGYLNSPLAKTLNLVIFPSRFDTKVVQSAGKIMARLSPIQQVAVVTSAARAKSFLDSPQGQKWQQDNSEAIGLLKAFTPLETLSGVQKFLFDGQHIQDLGEIGGLPFGVLSTMLTHQVNSAGHLGASQYFDPKTGNPVPSAIPTTLKARGQTALADLVGSMFSWPGKTAGLISKKDIVTSGGKNPLTTPAKGEVQYRYANGALEGSPNAPQAKAIGPAPTPPTPTGARITPQTVKPFSGTPTTGATSRVATIKKARVKSVPLSQRLPGS